MPQDSLYNETLHGMHWANSFYYYYYYYYYYFWTKYSKMDQVKFVEADNIPSKNFKPSNLLKQTISFQFF